jgi:hypothetical protein
MLEPDDEPMGKCFRVIDGLAFRTEIIFMRSLRATDDCASCLSNWGYITQSTPVIYTVAKLCFQRRHY